MKLDTAEDVRVALETCEDEYSEAHKNLAFKCIEKAKWLKDKELEFESRHKFISQCFFLNHDEESIPMFPKQLQFIDKEDPSLVQTLTTLWAYKWVVNALDEFCGISLEKIENIFADFERRFNDSGRAGNAVQDFRRKLVFGLGRPDEALKIYREMQEDPRSGLLDDCEACQVNNFLDLLMHHGLFEEVKELAQPILDGDLTCENVPKTTYPKLVYYHYLQGEWDAAEKCDSQIKKYLDEEHFHAGAYSHVLPFWGITKKYIRTLEVISHQMSYMTPRVSAQAKYNFFLACSLFFRAMQQQGEEWVSINTDLLEEKHLLKQNSEGKTHTASLEEVFLKMAQIRAQKLDTRNKNSFYTEEITRHKGIMDQQLSAYLNR